MNTLVELVQAYGLWVVFLITLLQSANKSFDVLVIRTHTALPYSSVFLELQPGYWDNESELRLRSRIEAERMKKLSRPGP